MNGKRKTLVGVFVAFLLASGVVWFVGFGGEDTPDSPDCSTISYDGDGTETNPYEVSNVDQLQCIKEHDLEANYVQVSDIDASGTSSWNSDLGFDPIERFSGTFNGQGRNITGLTTYRVEAGLFGWVGDGGEVTNVSLVNAEVTTSGGEQSSVAGVLVAQNRGTVSNSYAIGAVDRRGVGGVGNSIGGLVGLNGVSGMVEGSHASVSVDGNDARVGGLVGRNSGTVKDSYAIGPVSGERPVGGLVGSNFEGTINNSYATGSVDGSMDVGGIVGLNYNGVISKSYATGVVEGDGRVGGLLGSKRGGGTVNDSYWDMNTTGQPISAGNATGLTTAQMTGSAARENMRGFDFTDTWRTVTGDYPALAWQAERDTRD